MVRKLLQHFREHPRPCSYLSDRTASLEHRVMMDVSADELERLLERGWRRFGPDYFRPACGPCTECVPTRLDVCRFVASRSQRRARSRCSGLTITVGAPTIDDDRLRLYHRWHRERESERGWESSPLTEREYFLQFALPHPAVREVAYHDEAGELVGLGISDETERAWSAVYFFYAPEWGPRSLGVANVLFQVELAKARERSHVYLGYRVDGCASMAYKARFQPQERLIGWPDFKQTPKWALRPTEP